MNTIFRVAPFLVVCTMDGAPVEAHKSLADAAFAAAEMNKLQDGWMRAVENSRELQRSWGS